MSIVLVWRCCHGFVVVGGVVSNKSRGWRASAHCARLQVFVSCLGFRSHGSAGTMAYTRHESVSGSGSGGMLETICIHTISEIGFFHGKCLVKCVIKALRRIQFWQFTDLNTFRVFCCDRFRDCATEVVNGRRMVTLCSNKIN